MHLPFKRISYGSHTCYYIMSSPNGLRQRKNKGSMSESTIVDTEDLKKDKAIQNSFKLPNIFIDKQTTKELVKFTIQFVILDILTLPIHYSKMEELSEHIADGMIF